MSRRANVEYLPRGTEYLHDYQIPDMSHVEFDAPTQFIRSVDIVPPMIYKPAFSWSRVARLLATTDRELEKCARFCGAEVVPHTWGVVNDKYGERVVAKVDRIVRFCDVGTRDSSRIAELQLGHSEMEAARSSANLPPNVLEKLGKGLNRYNRVWNLFRPMQLDDLRSSRQFIYGFNLNNPEQAIPKLFLTDLEPVYGLKPCDM